MVQNQYSAKLVQFPILTQKVEELDHLEKLGIAKKVEQSEWASPIVCMPKKDGSIYICGDFKVSVNQVLLDIPYPPPETEDIFAKSGSGTVFSRIELSTDYQQMEA